MQVCVLTRTENMLDLFQKQDEVKNISDRFVKLIGEINIIARIRLFLIMRVFKNFAASLKCLLHQLLDLIENIQFENNNGWDHMICEKWKYNFWWSCLGEYTNYRHSDNSFCYKRLDLTKILASLFFIILVWNCLSSQKENIISKLIIFFIYFIYANCLALWFILEIAIVKLIFHLRSDLSCIISNNRIFIISLLSTAAIGYLLFYFYYCYCLWKSKDHSLIIKIVLVEVFIAILVLLYSLVFTKHEKKIQRKN